MPLQQPPEIDPVTSEAQPELKISLTHALKQMNCFASGQGAMKIEWLTKTEFRTRADQAIGTGRSRYNCTAPSTQPGRYYWFSQPWIKLRDKATTSPQISAQPHQEY